MIRREKETDTDNAHSFISFLSKLVLHSVNVAEIERARETEQE